MTLNHMLLVLFFQDILIVKFNSIFLGSYGLTYCSVLSQVGTCVEIGIPMLILFIAFSQVKNRLTKVISHK